MFQNYLKTAMRNLMRAKGSSFLNIAGLTLGITCSLVLFLMVKHLATFDRYHTNRDRIYRVVTQMDGNNKRFYTAGVPPVLPDAFREDFPEAEQVTFTSYRSGALVKVPRRNGDSKKFQEEFGVVFAESNFFKIFDRPLYIGDASHALDQPAEAVISRSLARKYFAREDVVGEVVRFDTVDYKITAVMSDFPDNTDFPFNLMLSYATIKSDQDKRGWGNIWSDEQCYILVKPGETDKMLSRMPGFVEKYVGKDNYNNETFALQPLSELHFDDRYSNYNYKTAPRELLAALGVIAAFLILTACINFVNLATAEAVKRSKEVGIRKSLGSTRRQLAFQFLGETTLVTLVAVVLSLAAAQMILSLLNPFLELPLKLDFAGGGMLWIFLVGVTIVVSLLSGLYPSLVLSRFSPAVALKNKMGNKSSSGFNLRRSLVIVQFVISQFFIMGTIILLSQMNYFQSEDLGFRKDAIIIVPIPENGAPGTQAATKVRTLREEVSRIPGIAMASLSSTAPSSGSVNSTGFYMDGQDEHDRRGTQVKHIDGNYLSLYEIPLLMGANLHDYDTARGCIVNEEFVRVAGFPDAQSAIGMNVNIWDRKLPIVGVVRDFHTVSLRDRIEPTLMMNNIDNYSTLSVQVNTADMKNVIGQLQTKWEAAYPQQIFDYKFLDDNIREFYEGEQKMSVLLTAFTSMAIFIGALGLFGLATFMTNQKTKEIGVRKALGATVESIILLFSREYVKLIGIGFAIASPAVWYVMNLWLQTFAYKITIGPMVFIAGLILTLLISVATVGYRSFRAARVNPVDSLRYE